MDNEDREAQVAAAAPWVAVQVRALARSSDPLGDAEERTERGLDVMAVVDQAPEPSEDRRSRLRRLWS